MKVDLNLCCKVTQCILKFPVGVGTSGLPQRIQSFNILGVPCRIVTWAFEEEVLGGAVLVAARTDIVSNG